MLIVLNNSAHSDIHRSSLNVTNPLSKIRKSPDSHICKLIFYNEKSNNICVPKYDMKESYVILFLS